MNYEERKVARHTGHTAHMQTITCPAVPGRFSAWSAPCDGCSCELAPHWDAPAARARMLAQCSHSHRNRTRSSRPLRSSASIAEATEPISLLLRGDMWCEWLGIDHYRPAPQPPPPPTQAMPARAIPVATTPSSFILGIHLVNAPGAYRPLQSTSDPQEALAKFSESATADTGLNEGWLQVHLLHDSTELAPRIETRTGAVLHRLPSPIRVGNASLPATDARWAAYGHFLRTERPPSSACVFMVDISDVRLLRDPSGLCRAHPNALFVGGDICNGVGPVAFLQFQTDRTGYRASGRLRTLMQTAHRRNAQLRRPYVHNAGVLGGRLAVLEPFRRHLASATREHYARAGATSSSVMDAALLNDLMLSYEGEVIGGFPRGVVTLPMAGDPCVRPKFNAFCTASRVENCTAKALIAAMVTSGRYFFSHKLDPVKAVEHAQHK